MTLVRIAPWTSAAALVMSAPLAWAQSAAPPSEPAPAATPTQPGQAPPPSQPYEQPGAESQAPADGAASQGTAAPAQGQPGQPPPAQPQGQPSPAGPPGGQQIYIEQPPPPPPVPRNRHYHDGFYTRLGVGVGHLWTTAKVDIDALGETATASLSGTGMMLDVAVGGTPAPGLVIGGALLLQDSFEPSISFKGPLTGSQQQSTAKNDSLGFVLIGPMIDGFPDTDGGLHVGGSVGAAVLGLADNQGNAAKGLGLSAWVGYLWWVSSQWSIGGTARFTVAGTGRDLDIGKSTETTRVLGLNLTALYH